MTQQSESLQDLSYHYTPLDEQNDEIRVITVEPNPLRGDVRCHLQIVSLQDFAPEFKLFTKSSGRDGRLTREVTSEWARQSISPASNDPTETTKPAVAHRRFKWGDFLALSYVWGDESRRRNIFVNDIVVSVTENLEIALTQLAADDDLEGGFKLWVDALCINQSDEKEQASQVNKMSEIYSGSWRVIAWLGLGTDPQRNRLAFEFLRVLAELEGDERDLSQTPLPHGCFDALHDLMKRQYWSRLWVVQEVIMGASSTVLRCGSDALDWELFCRAISVLYYGENWSFKNLMLADEHHRNFIPGDPRWHTTSLHLVHKDLRELSRFEEHGGERIGFRRLLEIAGSAQCRDIRDCVFALVGMMDAEIAHEIAKAYSLGIPKLFAVVTGAFIERYGNLEPLRQANPWGRSKAPGWAADWTWGGRFRWTRAESNFTSPLWDPTIPEPDPSTIYSAHGGRPACYEFLEDNSLLLCKGFILDRIAGLGAPEKGFFAWTESKMEQCLSWKSAYGGEAETKKALLWAIMGGRVAQAGRLEERHLALSSLPGHFYTARLQFEERQWKWFMNQGGYYFKWEIWRRANNHFMIEGRRLDSYFTDTLSDEFDESTYMDVYHCAMRMVQERRFMLTQNGYMGWAPDNAYDDRVENHTRVGDLIAIIFGCSTPLVLRPIGNKYAIVGEAYVEGFMDGEGIRLLESGKRQAEYFTFM